MEKKTSKSGRRAKKVKEETKAAALPEKKGGEELEIDSEAELSEGKDEKAKKAKRYFEAVGRRKASIARVRLFTIKPFEGDEGRITVNGKPYKNYFSTIELQQAAEAPLRKLKSLNRFEAVVKVKGGGISGQAEALRHGLSRTLTLFNQDFRKKLKKAGYLKRDPRVKERRKYGLKKARRAPQWSKR
jgi:small subunit ribosomal protein S9